MKSQQINYKVRLENLTSLVVLDVVSYLLNRRDLKFWRNAPFSRSHLSKTQYHIKFFGQIFMKLKPIDCNNSQSFISPKRRDTDGSRNVQILTLFKIKILSCDWYSIEFFSSQSHHSLLCSFLRVRDCFIYFSALSSAPCSFFAPTPKTSSSFLQPSLLQSRF